jgi:hypothetical protein
MWTRNGLYGVGRTKATTLCGFPCYILDLLEFNPDGNGVKLALFHFFFIFWGGTVMEQILGDFLFN